MSAIDHLQKDEAQAKIKELVDKADICLFTTALTKLPLSSRPMSTQRADEDGTLWFFSSKESHKDMDITDDNRVQLFYANKANYEFLSLFGTVDSFQDTEKARELWNSMAKTWWDGPEDPSLTILKFVPQSGYYWDTKDGKAVSMLKIAIGTITGKETDGSIEGKINP